MASAECEAITGFWGRSPKRGQGHGQGAKPPKAQSLSAFQRPMKAAITPLTESGKLIVCDVSTTLNRIPNSLLRTEGLKHLR